MLSRGILVYFGSQSCYVQALNCREFWNYFICSKSLITIGRKMRNPVRKYFIYDAANNTSTCQIDNCGRVMKGNHGANLERHIARSHKVEYALIKAEKQKLLESTIKTFPFHWIPNSFPQQGPSVPSPKLQQQVTPPPPPLKKVPQVVLKPKPPSPPPPPPEVCLRWNSYHTNMQAIFPSLLTNEQFVDVTLACEGRSIKCHKVMLSACSSYFEELLSQNPCQHPIVLMKDLRYWEVQALVEFMYRGEVNVGQDKLPSLLAAAEALQIKGLAGPASGTSSQEEDSIPLTLMEDSIEEAIQSQPSIRKPVKRRMISIPPQSMTVPKHSSPAPHPKPRVQAAVPSTSSYQDTSTSEPPVRRIRKVEAVNLESIKVEPIDIDISSDSMDPLDDNYMDKSCDNGETFSSSHLDDGGGGECSSSSNPDVKPVLQRQDSDKVTFENIHRSNELVFEPCSSEPPPNERKTSRSSEVVKNT